MLHCDLDNAFTIKERQLKTIKKKYNPLLKFVFVINSLVVLSVLQIKNEINLREYGKPYYLHLVYIYNKSTMCCHYITNLRFLFPLV